MYQPHFLAGIDSITYVFFGLVMAGIALTIRFSNKQEFDVTPMDYLIVLAMIMLGFLTRNEIVNTRVMAIALKTVILFYGAEVILNRMSNRLNLFTLAVLVSLLVVVGRGLLLHVL
jgi:UDP-GlcNAc:undecaprenyl-phosphate GlcNAc-1-phosphate transferase